MNICKNCNSQNVVTTKFCSECGRELNKIDNIKSSDYHDIELNINKLLNYEIDFFVINKFQYYAQVAFSQNANYLILEAVSDFYLDELKGSNKLFDNLGFKKIPRGNYFIEVFIDENTNQYLLQLIIQVFESIFKTPLSDYEIDDGSGPVENSLENISEPIINIEDKPFLPDTIVRENNKFNLPSKFYWIMGIALILFIGTERI